MKGDMDKREVAADWMENFWELGHPPATCTCYHGKQVLFYMLVLTTPNP
jgi:hypothetical protein